VLLLLLLGLLLLLDFFLLVDLELELLSVELLFGVWGALLELLLLLLLLLLRFTPSLLFWKRLYLPSSFRPRAWQACGERSVNCNGLRRGKFWGGGG